MHRHVELLLGRLATDPTLLERFARQPREVLREQGFALTEVELEALASTAPAALRALSAALDDRLRRASFELRARRGGAPESGPDET